ncbi:MAG: hypothetical protein JSV62_12850 [Promethearchaeota archaeon]|nr:MAG: hypothetical protein JSV62_12850 [Candidatus Lokiarchaeota archaeon]
MNKINRGIKEELDFYISIFLRPHLWNKQYRRKYFLTKLTGYIECLLVNDQITNEEFLFLRFKIRKCTYYQLTIN